MMHLWFDQKQHKIKADFWLDSVGLCDPMWPQDYVLKSTDTHSTRELFRSLIEASILIVVPSGSISTKVASVIAKEPPLQAFFFALIAPRSENVSATAIMKSPWCLLRYPRVKSICRFVSKNENSTVL